MIPQRYIDEWKAVAPWPTDAQVEQDLIIARALIEIFSDEMLRQSLAFRGGIALHKLYLFPQIRLQMRFLAIYIVTSHKKGISSLQLSKDIDITQKSAWFMLQRIRNCVVINDNEKLDNEVEVDETFVGGKNKNRHASKKVENLQGRSFKNKTPVLGMIERKGKLIAKVIESTKSRF